MISAAPDSRVEGSFRDPCGFMFRHEGALYRQVHSIYKENYDWLISSGLYGDLVRERLLVPHEEVPHPLGSDAYRCFRPVEISFVSYPYEWCFSQLKDAALTTLQIQKRALNKGMTLKDASAYNIQFHEGRPILIDTLSFERYQEGKPWIAYRQFCQHFLAPLALMSKKNALLGNLSRCFIDGVPLDITSSLLPLSTWFNWNLLINIHLHAASQKKFADVSTELNAAGKIGLTSLKGLVDSLEAAVKGLTWHPGGTQWADYYSDDSYTSEGKSSKEEIVRDFLEELNPKDAWDFGANTGHYSRLVARRGIPVISFDMDPACVERNYLEVRGGGEKRLLPLLQDLVNPSPAIGWGSVERDSLVGRSLGAVDTVLALALVHHLAISNNLPFAMIARFFSRVGRKLIIEFVPKSDKKVRKLLATREDVFKQYDQENFEREFEKYFRILSKAQVKDSGRVLYAMLRS